MDLALHKAGLKMPAWSPTDKKAQNIWTQASKIFAQQAKGNVNAHLGKEIRPNGIYYNVEKPALLKNKAVHKITEIGHDGKQNIVTKPRKKTRRADLEVIPSTSLSLFHF